MYQSKLKILHLEDLSSDAELVKRVLIKGNLDFELMLTDNRVGFLHALDNFKPDVILSDHSLPSFDSIEAIHIVKERGIKVPFILITPTISEEFAVEVMKEGAWDYILKDRLQRLPTAINNVMERYRNDAAHARAMAQIIANEALYREAEQIAQFGTWRTDLRTGRTDMSDAAYRVMGYEPGEIDLSVDFFDQVIHPEDLQGVRALIANTLNAGGASEMIFRVQGSNGQLRYIRSQFQIERDEEGTAMTMVGFNQNVTTQREAELKTIQLTQTLERKVKERTSQLEQSIRELESFSYSVSHDLRAPLRIINGYAALLMEEYKEQLDATAIEYIQILSDNAIQMGQLIEDLLNLSRLGLEAIVKTEVDMNTLVNVTLYEQKSIHPDCRPEITVDQLPDAVCSQSLMKQVWINLINNAMKYSSHTANPRIHISAYMTDTENVYFIKDNGAGFDMKFVHRLFGVFQRLHNKQEFEGTGVGLALVHRIISRHGGRVWAEGKVNEGATFYFSIPK